MALSAGQSITPLRQSMEIPGGLTLLKPSYLKDTKALAVKIVTVFTQNPEHGLPTVQAMAQVLYGQTGEPKTLMNGTGLTRYQPLFLRTKTR